jgi:sugar phosphate isomerase/epimerase
MFDTHNAVKEKDSHPELIRRYAPYIQHVHVNEMDGREPGTGDYDFQSLLAALSAAKYAGWVSLEAFDFSRDSRQVAEQSLNYLKKETPESALTQTS